ncbi:hypothetical protein HELRODRAFT_189594 [Helobdella robusta]|uniref:BTB domain-containing protein n=1 Tax=Helobdella robusta TaxID=6412 RepID=T1FR66_HELRO|nr:hypothetical protein HELRODRAFT_189594 [Helobdella robusta]ESN92733.1 hypothetical protein HELRODRAFT_189594 [Helobdella robusta]
MDGEMSKKRKIESVETDGAADDGESVEMNKKLKMEKEDDVDESSKIVLISNEGGRFEVDKDLLLQTSDYFRALANSGMRDAHSKELTLECLSDASLHEVNNFLSNIQLNEDFFYARDLCCVEKGLEGSFYLQIRSMTDKYLFLFSQHLNESTYANILQFANKFALFGAIERVFEFIFDNLKCIISRSEILSLSPEDMIRLVESELVNVEREFDVFDMILRWTLVDELRKQYAEPLFSKIKYNLMAVDKKKKANDILNDLQINLQTEIHGFRTIGTIVAFGKPDFKDNIQQPYFSSLPVYDFFKTVNKEATESPVVHFKTTNIQLQNFRKWGYSVCTFDNGIYFAGGYCPLTKEVSVYNPTFCKWSRLSDMQVARHGFYFGEMGGHLYAVAGETFKGVITRKVERYIPDEDRWYIMAPLPIAVIMLSGTACNGMLYVSGGWKVPDTLVNLVYMYNPALNQWSEKAPMLTARHDHVMTSVGNKIFVVGGRFYKNVDGVIVSEYVMDGEMFDCTTDQWTSVLRIKEPFNKPRTSVLINCTLYCFGFDYGNEGSQNLLSIQEINLKRFLNDNKSSPNALSDLAPNDELEKKISNRTDDEYIDSEDSCHIHKFFTSHDRSIYYVGLIDKLL